MRIVSLAPSNTEILYDLGLEEEIVATTSLCDRPEKAMEKPSIGGWTNPDIEKVREFNPDIVVASDDLQDRAVEELSGEDFEVLQVRPHTLEEVKESIITIGEAVGRVKEARNMVNRFEEQLEELNFDCSPRVYCEEWVDPPMVSGNWIPGLVEEAGGEYFIEEGVRSREFDLQDLKDFDPEFIFLNVCGAGENIDSAEVMERPGWQDVTAVENGNVFVVHDSLLNRPSTRLVEGLEKMKERIDG